METVILTKGEFDELINLSFLAGAHSFNNRMGQPDTCWSNVHQDAEEHAKEASERVQNAMKERMSK